MTTVTRWLPSDRRRRTAVIACLLALSLAAAAAILGPGRSALASMTDRGPVTEAPATRHVPSSEQTGVAKLDHDRIAELADPVPMPTNVPLPGELRGEGVDGPAQSFRGTGLAGPPLLPPTAPERELP